MLWAGHGMCTSRFLSGSNVCSDLTSWTNSSSEEREEMPLTSPSQGDTALIHFDNFHLYWTVGEHPLSYTSVLWQNFSWRHSTHISWSKPLPGSSNGFWFSQGQTSSGQLRWFLLLPGSASLFVAWLVWKRHLVFTADSESWSVWGGGEWLQMSTYG